MCTKSVGSGLDVGNDILALPEVDPDISTEFLAKLLLLLAAIYKKGERDLYKECMHLPIAITRSPRTLAY